MSTLFTAIAQPANFNIGFAPATPGRLINLMRHACAVARQRRQLRHLSDRQLDDLGLTRGAAEREAQRPLWDLPKRHRGNF